MEKVIIIGGGVAGLTAAAALAARGVRVSLFESRPYLGGRIYSFTNPLTGDSVDNGQHIFTGFYHETFRFLNLIGSRGYIKKERRLEIDFFEKGGGGSRFAAPFLPSPLHFLWGLLKYPKFPKRDVLRLVVKRRKAATGGMSARDYLKNIGQSEAAVNYFFRPLALATLNADPTSVSGALFKSVLEAFLSVPASDSVLAYSTVGFSRLIAEPASRFIIKCGGDIYYSTPVEKILVSHGRVSGIVDYFGREHVADAYIVALPPDMLGKIIPEGSISGLDRWSYSPIVSVNLWYNRPITDKMMAGFLNANFHWFFDKQKYVTLLASAANAQMDISNDELTKMAISDINIIFPRARSLEVVASQVIREKKATVLMTPEAAASRPGAETGLPNLFLAGDWINTGLPATVESAAKSGFTAAELVL